MGISLNNGKQQIQVYNSLVSGIQSDAERAAAGLGIDLSIDSGGDEFIVNNQNIDEEDVSSFTGKNYTQEEAQALIENYNATIDALKKAVEECNAAIERLNAELAEEQETYDKLDSSYKKAEKNYKEQEEAYNENKELYDEIQVQIEEATKDLEDDLKKQQQDAINKAMANYNAEKDGDYKSYLEKSLNGIAESSSLSNLIDYLSSYSSDLLSEMSNIRSKMSSYSEEMSFYETLRNESAMRINLLESEISTQQAMKDTANSQITSMQTQLANIALASISSEEKQLVLDNNIDLTETFPDGSPKYIIAMGRSDNKYHIYEMDSQGSCSATSLARKYGASGGYDIVASGNGYMNNLSESSSTSICNTVFNFTCISDDLSTGSADCRNMDYCTSSPLSFDMNGDGVKTSEELVEFDIDGDGFLDLINNSADAVLVFDSDGDGISGTSGLECFGDNTDLDGDGIADGFANGFDALKSLAKNANLINGKDDNVLDENDLKYMEENFGLKIKLNGYNDEATSLSDAGISAINLSVFDDTQMQKNFDGLYNDLMTQEGATFILNGEEMEYADIWHSKKE